MVRLPDRSRRSPVPTHELSRPGIPDPLAFLHDGEVEVEGRMPWASNATFLVTVRCGDAEQRAIYKPVRGERPLWDFEPGLHRRELAAFVLSELLGLGVGRPRGGSGPMARVAAMVRRRRPQRALLHDLRAPTRRARAAAIDRRARSARQQHRPQERPLPARRRSRVGDRQRAVLRGAVQVAHGDLGVRRRTDRRISAVARRGTGRIGAAGVVSAARRRRGGGAAAPGKRLVLDAGSPPTLRPSLPWPIV